MTQSSTRPMAQSTTQSWQLWRDRRGHLSWLRVGTLVVLLRRMKLRTARGRSTN